MDGADLIGEFVKVIGGAGVGVGIMYLWIKNLLKENQELKADLKDSQSSRVEELKNVLPLLTSASEGLQEVISNNKDRDNTLIESIAELIDNTVKKIGVKCNYVNNGGS